jgi:hypothetical protein
MLAATVTLGKEGSGVVGGVMTASGADDGTIICNRR